MEVYSTFIATHKRFLCLLPLFLFLSLCAACQKSEPKVASSKTVPVPKQDIDLTLDSSFVLELSKKEASSLLTSTEVIAFYARRNYQLGWFNNKRMSCGATNFYTQLKSYSLDFEDNSLNNKLLDSLMLAFENSPNAFLLSQKQVQQLDILLTVKYFDYAHKVYGGTTKKATDLEWFIPRKKKNYQALLDTLVSSELCKNLQEPVNQYYIRLRIQLKKYRTIQKQGGFPTIAESKKTTKIDVNDSSFIQLKRYLVLSGDLALDDKTIIFTESLSQALKAFQHRMGKKETGNMNRETLLELNKPIEERIQQMMVNMERLRWIPVELEKKYILVNIPAFKLHVFDDGQPIWATNVVVGKAARQTSIFRGNLSQVILNPYWGVPTSIVRNEMLPRIKKNPHYLTNNHMEVYSGSKVIDPTTINWAAYKGNVPFDIRQKPGKSNALGKMKFMFPNNYHIYLHDTPSKSLFGETSRAFSHGCIRVENPIWLAYYLAKTTKSWSNERIDETLETDQQTGIRITPTVPVYIVYFTAWVDDKGLLNFRNDVYQLDAKLANEIF